MLFDPEELAQTFLEAFPADSGDLSRTYQPVEALPEIDEAAMARVIGRVLQENASDSPARIAQRTLEALRAADIPSIDSASMTAEVGSGSSSWARRTLSRIAHGIRRALNAVARPRLRLPAPGPTTPALASPAVDLDAARSLLLDALNVEGGVPDELRREIDELSATLAGLARRRAQNPNPTANDAALARTLTTLTGAVRAYRSLAEADRSRRVDGSRTDAHQDLRQVVRQVNRSLLRVTGDPALAALRELKEHAIVAVERNGGEELGFTIDSEPRP